MTDGETTPDVPWSELPASRRRCPRHELTDCSPLLNGCSRVNEMAAEHEARRGGQLRAVDQERLATASETPARRSAVGGVSISTFLLARFNDAERNARDCAKLFRSDWYVNERGHSATLVGGDPEFVSIIRLDESEECDPELPEWLGDGLEHIARHDPTRVLADIAAKRQIVSTLTSWEPDTVPPERVETAEHDAWRMLCLLASPYANHPDFQAEWRS